MGGFLVRAHTSPGRVADRGDADYARLDDVQAELFRAQTGAASPAEPGDTAVASFRSYVGAIGKAFQYDVRPENAP